MTDTIERDAAACLSQEADQNRVGNRRGRAHRMLNRQRVILALIQSAGGTASHLRVTKWAFLLREESQSRGGSSFYQFLPYKYGPFSFCLFQEAAALCRDGLLTESESEWTLTSSGVPAARQIHAGTRSEVARVISDHGKKTERALIDYVYERFPEYTVNSEIRQLERRKTAAVAVYTAGYEGLLIDGFLAGLIQHGVCRIIDVRNNPVSRRYGFHKSTLSRLSERVGVEYVHVPELGIASDHRQDLEEPGARQKLFETYERTTLVREGAVIARVAALVEDRPSVLVCMEACHTQCHRSRLANAIAAKTRLPLRHLDLAP